MAGKTPREAVQNFVGPLQTALSCVTNSVLQIYGGYYPRSEPHVATIADGDPVPLRGDSRISLQIRHWYRIVEDAGPRGPWKVQTAGYYYSLKDSSDQEILAYHWHPQSEPTFPHLHLEAGAGIGRQELTKAHLPTERISLEHVLRIALNDFGCYPLKPDWEEVLAQTQSAYDE